MIAEKGGKLMVFGRKKILANVIKNASANNIGVYKIELIELMKIDMDSLNETQQDELLAKMRRAYFDAVNSDVINSLNLATPGLGSLAEIKLKALDNQFYGIMGGRLFSTVYEVMTGKYVDGSICIELNHYQDDLMKKAIHEVSGE